MSGWVVARCLLCAALLAGCAEARAPSLAGLDAGAILDNGPDASTGVDAVSGPDLHADPDSGAADPGSAPDSEWTADSRLDRAVDGDSTADGDAADTHAEMWRSSLYPGDWTPAFTDGSGRFLHDFSYAGYKNGEAEPAGSEGLEADVVADHGADPSGAQDSTAAFQAAIDAVTEVGGGVVLVPPGLFVLEGTLQIAASHTVLRGAGPDLSRLRFTRFEGLSHQAHIRVGGALSLGADLPLAQDADARETVVAVEDASTLVEGDDVALGWVITDDFVDQHGMAGTWQAFNGAWQPFAWRTVVSVDTTASPHQVTVDVPLRSAALVANQASLRPVAGYLEEVGVESLGLANAVDHFDAWTEDQVHVLELRGVKDGWVRDVASFAPPGLTQADPLADGSHLQSSGVLVRDSKRVTVSDSSMQRSQHRGGGGNGYLFEVRVSSEILFADCVATHGRHNFIQNWGFGATGIVWLRVRSEDGLAELGPGFPGVGSVGLSEFHHSLATANLIDNSFSTDGWGATNRKQWSSGAGHCATENVFWNTRGDGAQLQSLQFGWGYVIGTWPGVNVFTDPAASAGEGTAPEDFVEGEGLGAGLVPVSLYEDQLSRRLGR